MNRKRREYLTLLALGTAGTVAGCASDDEEGELEPVDDDINGEDNGNEEVDTDNDGVDEGDDELRQTDLSFGDVVEHPDGFHITPFEPTIIESFEIETFDEMETIEPENEQFVFIEIEIENLSDSTLETPNALDFRTIVDGTQYERESLGADQPDDFERYPSLETLAPGSTVSGELVFDTVSGDVELFYSGLTEDFDEVEAIWS